MEWSERGLILGLKKHGETSVILELMTRGHGRHLGVVRGGRRKPCSRCCSRAMRSRRSGARGWRSISGFTRSRRRLLRTDAAALQRRRPCTASICSARLLRLLPERDPHPGLYERAQVLLAHLPRPLAPALVRAFRTGAAGRTRLRPRSRRMRRDRRARRPDLCVAEIGPRRQPRRRARPGRRGCCRCRLSARRRRARGRRGKKFARAFG